MLNNLMYRIQRIFTGERGVVIAVNPPSDKVNHPKDDIGQVVSEVTFMNPLGEKITERAGTIPVLMESYKGRMPLVHVCYKPYEVGDNFP